MRARARRGFLLVAAIVLVTVPVAFGVRSLLRTSHDHSPVASMCTVGAYSLDTSQASVAATMIGVVTGRGLPERAGVLSLAAALQESKLRNLGPGQGDRDSVGVLQQRPSQGWGKPAQLNDVRYATSAFLDALVKIAKWQTLPLADAIQKVQVSADGSLYAVHEPEAQALADALSGRAPRAITCTFEPPTVVASTARVAQLVGKELPINPPQTTTSSVRVPGAAWQTVAWFVANADRLGVDSVAYDKHVWTRAKGWRDGSAGVAAVVATMHVKPKS